MLEKDGGEMGPNMSVSIRKYVAFIFRENTVTAIATKEEGGARCVDMYWEQGGGAKPLVILMELMGVAS